MQKNHCVGNILRIWQEGQADKLTQLLFCDLSTPKNDGTFNVYDDIKAKLMANSVPAEEVAFIHDADTEAKKKELFAKVRTGQVRVLLGIRSMGAYLRKMALDGYCINLDLQDVKALVSLLRICSNNLNQYAKRANETGSIYEADIKDLQERLETIWADMKEVLVRLSSIQ